MLGAHGVADVHKYAELLHLPPIVLIVESSIPTLAAVVAAPMC